MAYPAGFTLGHEVDPVSRIEGHLGIAISTSGSPAKVSNAYAHGNLWRGFENFLLGRDANDAITFVQRICGVCPVPHGMTSTYAVDTVLGYSRGHITFSTAGESANTFGVPARAVLIRNLVLGMEFLMSSITHFYHLAAPSYIQGPKMPPWTPYFADSYYHVAMRNTGSNIAPVMDTGFSQDLWSAVIFSYVKALRVRRLTFEAAALFAGRMPMTSVLIGGGVMFDGNENIVARCATFKSISKEVGEFIVQEYVPIALALGALYPNWDNVYNANTLFTAYNSLWNMASGGADPSTSGNSGYGAGLKRFLAWGAFPDTTSTGTLAFAGGVKFAPGDSQTSFTIGNKAAISGWLAGGAHSVPGNLTEDIAYSRYQVDPLDKSAYIGTSGASYPSGHAAYPGAVSRTHPDRSNGYTYMKAPRWNGLPCEVGPMARMYVAGNFVEGQALASNANIGGAYATYLKTSPTNASIKGLDPMMVSADVAVGLARTGLATLTLGNGTVVAGASLSSLGTSGIITNYAASGTVITGPIYDWVRLLTAGFSTMDRLRGRALESLVLVQAINGAYSKGADGAGWNVSTGAHTGSWGSGWIDDLSSSASGVGTTWATKSIPPGVAQGWGATEAPRGALMHQCEINNGKITKYQCIVPTTWNGSPIDAAGNHGAIEAACIGVPFTGANSKTGINGDVDSVGGVEVLRVAQSFDPCIACAVH